MARKCAVCGHAARETINRELASGGDIKTLSAFHGVSTDSLHRHKRNHLLPAQRGRLASDPELSDVDVLAEMRTLYRKMKDHLDRAELANDWPSLVAFHREARADLELFSRLTERLGPETQVNVNVAIDQRAQQVILSALEPFPDARVAVAVALGELE